jgi:hypothetical protein
MIINLSLHTVIFSPFLMFLPSFSSGTPYFEAMFSWHVCLLYILLYRSGLENQLSMVTWYLWLRRGAISSNTTFESWGSFARELSKGAPCPTDYKIPDLTRYSFTQFILFYSKSSSFWGDVYLLRHPSLSCHQWLIHWHFTLCGVHTPKPIIEVV